jgi:HEAT repeat protein
VEGVLTKVLLEDKEAKVRREAARLLWYKIKLAAEETHKAMLTAFLRDTDPGVRHIAAEALGDVEPIAEIIIDELKNFIRESEDHLYRALAKEILRKILGSNLYSQNILEGIQCAC